MRQIMDVLGIDSPQAGIGLAFLVATLLLVVGLTRGLFESSKRDRLLGVLKAKHVGASEQAASAIMTAEQQSKKNTGRTDQLPFEVVNFRAISRDMRKAGLPSLPPLIFVGAAAFAFALARFGINAPIFSVWAQFLALLPPSYLLARYSFLGYLIGRRKLKTLTQLITFIDSVQRAVSVGAAADEAVTEAIKAADRPLRDDLLSVKDLLELGYDFVQAVNLAADKVDLPEFDIFAASITAQSGTGGSIGSVLAETAEIARRRLDLQRKVTTMTAEGRVNALILGSVPIGLTLFLRNGQPEYFAQLWSIPAIGALFYFGSMGLAVLGAFLALKIATVKV